MGNVRSKPETIERWGRHGSRTRASLPSQALHSGPALVSGTPQQAEELGMCSDDIEPSPPGYSGRVLMRGGLGLREPPEVTQWQSFAEIYLMENQLTELREDPPLCPVLLVLFLNRNYKLRTISPSFFDSMPALEILNLSRTRIKSLPESLFRISSLKRLFLNHCELLSVLPPKIGELQQLEVLDLEGTEIMDLPKEIANLTKLTCLEVCFCRCINRGTKSARVNALIPQGTISALSQLEELSIDVNPGDKRWESVVEAIVDDVCGLLRLDTLKLYFPHVEHLRKFKWFRTSKVSRSLSHFKFIVGDHGERIMSRLPVDLEFELEHWDRSLKYVNGVGVPGDIQKMLRHTTAFFLDRHTDVIKLSDFGIENMKQLKCCIIGECNEIEVIIDETDTYNEADRSEIVLESWEGGKSFLGSLEYLYVYHMKSLRGISKGPINQGCLSHLKCLALLTCPRLTTIFTPGLLINLDSLEELKVEACPLVFSLVRCDDASFYKSVYFLPKLKKISLFSLPELISISSGLRIAPNLERMSIIDCPNLKSPSPDEICCNHLTGTKGKDSGWTLCRMGSDVGEVVERPFPSSFKVHHALCAEVMKIVNKVSSILPEIKAAQPRCSAGIQALCLLNRAIEKANLLLQNCSESSKLYLALTGDAIVARCERLRNMLEQSLGQLQNMVPGLLAIQISKSLDDLRSTTFILEPSEKDAGEAVCDLIRSGPSESGLTELKTLQFAASKLFITSQKSILVERRSIKKLVDKVGESDLKKKKILLYLSSLLKKYGNSIASGQVQSVCMEKEGTYLTADSQHNSVYAETAEVAESPLPGHREAQVVVTVDAIPPEEFKCPLSLRLMYEPVIIASGQTFERMWIEKWFDEGNTFCPKTKVELAHQLWAPNTALKVQISQWCTRHGLEIPYPIIQRGTVDLWDISGTQVSSLLDSSLDADFSNVSLWSLESSNNSESSLISFANAFNPVDLLPKTRSKTILTGSVHEEHFDIFSKLTELSWQSQCKVVEDFKSNLEHNRQSLHSAPTENFLEPLVRFLGESRDLGDVKAQKTALQLLLTFFKKSRYEAMHVHQDGFSMLASFLDSEVAEQAIAIVEILSAQPDCRLKVANSGAIPSILEILDCEIRDIHVSALKILYNLCLSSDLRLYVIPCIPKLVRFLKDSELAKYALLIIRNLCDIEEGRISITVTQGCITSVAELLESRSNEEQEHAMAILLSLCSQRVQYCQLVLDEGCAVIPALVKISINGTERSKVRAMELLRLFRDANDSDGCDFSDLDPPMCVDPGYQCSETKPSSRMSGFFGQKLSIFSKKPVSAAPQKKK